MDKELLKKISKMNTLALMAIAKEMDEKFDITAGMLKNVQGYLYKDLIREGAIEENAILFDHYIKTADADHKLFSIKFINENS